MEPLKNEQATRPVEQKPNSTGQRLEAIRQNPEQTANKAENTPILTRADREQGLYLGGVVASLVIALIALFIAINANRDRTSDQTALVQALTSSFAKLAPGPNVGAPTQTNGANSANNGQNTSQNGGQSSGQNSGSNSSGNNDGNSNMNTNQGNK